MFGKTSKASEKFDFHGNTGRLIKIKPVDFTVVEEFRDLQLDIQQSVRNSLEISANLT